MIRTLDAITLESPNCFIVGSVGSILYISNIKWLLYFCTNTGVERTVAS